MESNAADRGKGKLDWKRVSAWSLYDFANSPYSTIMTTVGFPIYFTEVIAPGVGGVLGWGMLYGVSMAIAALLAPTLGAWSDNVGRRKPFLVGFTALAIAGTALCSLIGQGQVALAWLLFGMANIGFGCSIIFYNAMIVEVSPPDRLPTVSGIGWATGYIGGIVGLLLALPFFLGAATGAEADGFRTSFLLVAAIFAVFALPLLITREKGIVRADGLGKGLAEGYRRVFTTLRKAKAHRAFFLFVIAYFFINDALTTIIIFAGPYARSLFHTETKRVLLLFILLNVIAAVGALLLGEVAERFGTLRTLIALAASWCLLVSVLAVVRSEHGFFLLAGVAGLLIGSTQAVARAIAAKLAPDGSEGEFFGFFALAGKFSAVAGPVVFGSAVFASGTMRAGAWSTLPFFLVGLLLLLRLFSILKKGRSF